MPAWTPVHAIEILAGTPPGGGLDRTARTLLDALKSQHLLDVRAPVIRVFDSALDAVADVVAGGADVAAVTPAGKSRRRGHGARGLNAGQMAYWESALRDATRAASWAHQLAQHYWTPMLVTGAALHDHLAHEQTQMSAVLAEPGFKSK